MMVRSSLTVFFEAPFWVGVYERESKSREQKEAEKVRKYEQRQQKRREKHRGH